MDNLYQQVKEIIAGEIKVPVGRLADDLTIEDLGLDSLTLAEMLIVLQQKMGQTIQSSKLVEEANRDTSLSELINKIIELMQEKKDPTFLSP